MLRNLRLNMVIHLNLPIQKFSFNSTRMQISQFHINTPYLQCHSLPGLNISRLNRRGIRGNNTLRIVEIRQRHMLHSLVHHSHVHRRVIVLAIKDTITDFRIMLGHLHFLALFLSLTSKELYHRSSFQYASAKLLRALLVLVLYSPRATRTAQSLLPSP